MNRRRARRKDSVQDVDDHEHGNADVQETTASDRQHPMLWERIVAASMAILVVCLVLYLLIRNTPFSDPNLVVLVRIVLAVAMAIFSATVPGFLNVGWTVKGLAVRSGGALAVAVLVLLWTPKVLQTTPTNEDLVKAARFTTIPSEYGISRKTPLGAEFSIVIEDVPAGCQLRWAEPKKGKLSVNDGECVKYAAPTKENALGHESLEVIFTLAGQQITRQFGFEIVRPF